MRIGNSHITFLLLFVLSLSSCSTDLELEAEWRNVPLINAFVNRSDTAHYVRLEKAFLEPGGNAQEIAQIADSLYYDDDEIQLELVVNDQNRYTLGRVDGNLEGYVREDGVFAQSPNYLYKIKQSEIDLKGNESLRVELWLNDGETPFAQANTLVIDSIVFQGRASGDRLRIQYGRTIRWRWRVNEAAQLFDVRMFFNYLERAPGTTDFVPQSVEWVIDDELERGTSNEVVAQFDGEDLYRFLGEAIEADGSVRQLTSMEFQVTGVGQEMVELLEIVRANAGITSSQSTPTYSNVEGGQGVFTSRSRSKLINLSLEGDSVDSLRDGIYTRDLNFFQ